MDTLSVRQEGRSREENRTESFIVPKKEKKSEVHEKKVQDGRHTKRGKHDTIYNIHSGSGGDTQYTMYSGRRVRLQNMYKTESRKGGEEEREQGQVYTSSVVGRVFCGGKGKKLLRTNTAM